MVSYDVYFEEVGKRSESKDAEEDLQPGQNRNTTSYGLPVCSLLLTRFKYNQNENKHTKIGDELTVNMVDLFRCYGSSHLAEFEFYTNILRPE